MEPAWFAEAHSFTYIFCLSRWMEATCLLRCLHPRASWKEQRREGTPVGAPSQAPAGHRTGSLSQHLPPQAAQCHPVPRWELVDHPHCPLAEVSTLPPPSHCLPVPLHNSQPLPSGLSPSLPLALRSSASPGSSGLSPLFEGSSCSWSRV